jgi:hypothetical protein
MASTYFFKTFVTVLVAPVTTAMILHIMVHTCCISIHKLLYFNLFSASFYMTFLFAGIAMSISMHIFSFMFLIIISGLRARTSLSVGTS